MPKTKTPVRERVVTPVLVPQLDGIIAAYAGETDEPNRATVHALAVQLRDTLKFMEETIKTQHILTCGEAKEETVSWLGDELEARSQLKLDLDE